MHGVSMLKKMNENSPFLLVLITIVVLYLCKLDAVSIMLLYREDSHPVEHHSIQVPFCKWKIIEKYY